jgi:hypothetical protein
VLVSYIPAQQMTDLKDVELDHPHQQQPPEGKVLRTPKEISDRYKRLKQRSLALATASMAMVPQKLLSLITFLSTDGGANLSAEVLCFYAFVGVGLLGCFIQLLIMLVHHVMIGDMKTKDTKHLHDEGPFPAFQLRYKNNWYRTLFWFQIGLISVYSMCFVISDASMAYVGAS